MGIHLLIDIREHGFLQAYRNAVITTEPAATPTPPPSHPIHTMEVVSLELGDFQIRWAEEGLHYIFERKTFADLAASIKDGRYREQKARLLATFHPDQLTYVLEDVNTERIFHASSRHGFFGLSKSAYQSFLLHARYRDGFHIHVSSGIDETLQYLLEFMQRLHAHPEYFRRAAPAAQPESREEAETQHTDYINHCAIKSRKKDNLTPMVCFQLQLGQIPGISATLAKSLSQQVGSMRELMEKLNPLSYSEATHWLQSVPLIGKKKAEIICQYLGITPE